MSTMSESPAQIGLALDAKREPNVLRELDRMRSACRKKTTKVSHRFAEPKETGSLPRHMVHDHFGADGHSVNRTHPNGYQNRCEHDVHKQRVHAHQFQ